MWTLIQQLGIGNAIKIVSYGSALVGILLFMNNIMDTRADNVRLKTEVKTLTRNLKIKELELSLGKEAMMTLDNSCKAQAARFLREHDIWKKIDDSKDPLTDAANFSLEKTQ